jgi:hypothetical protein
MAINLKLTSAIIQALANGLDKLVQTFDKYRVGAIMLIFVILSIGTAMAISHVQVVMT